jgi:uncharacterized protein (DUF305 family)
MKVDASSAQAAAPAKTRTSSSSSTSSASTSTSASTTSSSTSAPTPTSAPRDQAAARRYITTTHRDWNTIQVSVQSVQVALDILRQHPKQVNLATVDQLAQLAQQSHDSIDGVRDDFATGDDSGALENAEADMFDAANGLKNSMGAVVAYTGNPNPATLASFTSQYQGAEAEWNGGVRKVWRLAHKPKPPTL